MTEPGHDLDAVGALAEPHRRALYDYVVAQRTWVSREQAAAALDLGRGVTAHHLDRLEDEGLLESEHRRLNDRRGPGAGRPAKVYRRTSAEISVNLPPAPTSWRPGSSPPGGPSAARSGATPIATAIDRATRDEASTIGATVSSASTPGRAPGPGAPASSTSSRRSASNPNAVTTAWWCSTIARSTISRSRTLTSSAG